MSLVIDDKSIISNSHGAPAGTRKRSNSRNLGAINPESPRTIDACVELGVNPNELRQKYYFKLKVCVITSHQDLQSHSMIQAFQKIL